MPYWKKQAKRAGRYAKKRYFKGKGYSNPKLQTIARDVLRLKNMVNAEKQNVDSGVTSTFQLAQYNGAAGGYVSRVVMPTVAQGVGEDQRKGDTIKVVSYCMKIQTNSKSAMFQDIKYKFYLVSVPINPFDNTDTAINAFLEGNPFTTGGIRDYNSNRNYRHFRDFRVLGTCEGKLRPMDDPSATSFRENNHVIAGKKEFHIRYEKGTTTILNNRLFLFAVASAGDTATTNYMEFQYNLKVFYYDN